MPNWCENMLVVRGPHAKEFVEACRGNGRNGLSFSFNALVPIPQEVREAGAEALTDWTYANWGTRSEPDEIYVRFSENEARINFDTAWRPPKKWLEKVAAMYPDLEFRLSYFEPGMFFAGCVVFKEGRCVEDLYADGAGDLFWEIAEELGYSKEMFG